MDIPGRPQPSEADFDQVLRGGYTSTPGARVRELAAAVRAMVHRGKVVEANAVTVRRALPIMDAGRKDMGEDELVAAYAIFAAATLLAENVQVAATCAKRAMNYAKELSDKSFLFRAEAIRSAVTAVNGDSLRAAQYVQSALQLAREHELAAGVWPLIVAHAFIRGVGLPDSFPEIDAAVTAAMLPSARDDALLQAALRMDRCVVTERSGDFSDAIDRLLVLVFGAGTDVPPPLIDDASWHLLILLLIHINDVADAMEALETRQPRPEGAVDFDALWGQVLCKTGQFSKALMVADGCVQRHRHSRILTASVTGVLLRSVAHWLMDARGVGQVEFTHAWRMSAALGNALPALGMPAEPIRELAQSSGFADTPQGAWSLQRFLADPKTSFPAPPTDGGVLAPRQAAIANLLLTDLSFSQIAAKLHISVNTVKSHVKAIYEKLGVDSRQDVARVVTTQPWLLPHGGLLDAFGAEGIPDGRPSSPATRSR